MLKLQDLPTDETLDSLSCRYEDMDSLTVKACLLLVRLGSDVLQELDAYLKKNGLSQGRFFTLTVMNRNPEKHFTAHELAEALGVSSATMTGLLDKLEADKLIVRAIDAQDRRRLRVQLSKKGEQLLDDILPQCFCSLTDFMNRLDRDELDKLTEFIGKLSTNISALKSLHQPEGR